MVNTMSNETLDEPGVLAKFNVRADQVLDMLTLTGDAVDNVPGRDQGRPEDRRQVACQYDSLDNIVAHADEIGGVVGANLREALPWLPQGRRLLTVKTDCDLPLDADRPRGSPRRTPRRSRRCTSASSSGAGCAISTAGMPATTIPRARSPRAPQADDAGRRWDSVADALPQRAPPPPANRHYEMVVDEAALKRWFDMIDRAELTAFDTETTSLDPMQARIVGVSLSVAPGQACYIPLDHRYAGVPDQLPREATLARLAPWLADPGKKKLGQNMKYDEHALANDGLALRGVAHDTLLESYVLEAHKPHDMDSLAWRHLDVKTITYDEMTGKGANRIGFAEVALDRATEYAAEDADVTLRLHQALYPAIAADAKLDHVYTAIELPVREVLFRMERNGILVDARLLARQSHELGERVLALEQQAYALAGQPFNLGSPKQLGEILFQRMNLPVVKKTATGAAVDRRGSAAGTLPPTIRCRSCCSSTVRCRSSSRPTPTSCRRWSIRIPDACTRPSRRRLQ